MATLEQLLHQMVATQQQNNQIQQQQQQQFMHFVAKQAQQVASPNANAGSGGRLTDLRGLGCPPTFAGDYEKYRERTAKLTNFCCQEQE